MADVPSMVRDKGLAKMENLCNQLFWEKERSHLSQYLVIVTLFYYLLLLLISYCVSFINYALSEVCMHRTGPSTHRVRYHPWFLDSTRGPESITLGYGRGTACGPAPTPWLPHTTGRLTEPKCNCLQIRGADAGVTVPWGNTGRVSGDLFGSHGQGRMLPATRG